MSTYQKLDQQIAINVQKTTKMEIKRVKTEGGYDN